MCGKGKWKRQTLRLQSNSGYSVYTCLADFKLAPLSENECDCNLCYSNTGHKISIQEAETGRVMERKQSNNLMRSWVRVLKFSLATGLLLASGVHIRGASPSKLGGCNCPSTVATVCRSPVVKPSKTCLLTLRPQMELSSSGTKSYGNRYRCVSRHWWKQKKPLWEAVTTLILPRKKTMVSRHVGAFRFHQELQMKHLRQWLSTCLRACQTWEGLKLQSCSNNCRHFL